MRPSASIALATAPHLPDLIPDDRRLLEALRARGARARAAVWDAPLDWGAFDAVLVRSCWDSHLRRDEFVRWARDVEARGVTLRNPAALLEWNTDKRYLRDLAALAARAPGAVMVQPFVPEVLAEGEWSLVFLGGRFSHAVRKRPRGGDFRVQSEHGGLTESAVPADVHYARAADALLAMLAGAPSGEGTLARHVRDHDLRS